MARTARARRYAQAIFQIASERNELDRWLDDLAFISQALRAPDFMEMLQARRLPIDEKVRLANVALLPTTPMARNLVFLLAQKRQVGIIDDVLDAYRELYNEARGIAEVEVSTAIALNDAELDQVRTGLAAATGKQIILRSNVAPELLGGILVRIGDRIIDGSIRQRLALMRQTLAGVS